MTATIDTTARPPAPFGAPAQQAPAATRPLTRTAWPWMGVLAGVAGTVATVMLNSTTPSEADTDSGVEAVYRALDHQGAVRVGASLGFLATYALVVFAVGFSRHLGRRLPADSLLPQVVRLALTAGVGTLIIGFGLKAAAAGGMPGGIDEAFYTQTDSVVISTLAGQLQWVGWQGAAIAMAATVVAALRHRVLPRWVGVVGAFFTLFVAAFTLGLCLPYSAGIVVPPFVALLGIALLASRDR